ncbi:DUF3558 family protein [Actinokineospora sp.]|uniref:DUF3558 family protein n=1 Tax=Actinokineospora sp. TaxID=1872133 RepID=UPI003D6B9CE4
MRTWKHPRIGSIRRWLAVITCAASTIACGTSGQPTPPNSTASRPSSPPPIDRELDASVYHGRLCELFTDEQAKVEGFDKPGEIKLETNDRAAACSRFTSSGGVYRHLIIEHYPNFDFLGSVYRGRSAAPLMWPREDWAPHTVAGQPAARTTFPIHSVCRIAIGLSPNQGIVVDVGGVDRACAQADSVAEEIVRKLGG